MAARECPVYTCRKRLRRGQTFMCARHWAKVPPVLRDAYTAERDAVYARGGHTTVGLLQAMADAMTAVNGGA